MARINIAHGTAKPAGLGPNEPWLDDATGILYVGGRPVTGSNRNLLVNGDFAVNQRGQGSYTGVGYAVDMWAIGGPGGTSVEAQADGVQVTLAPAYGSLSNPLEGFQNYLGRTLTASIEVTQCSGGTAMLYINDGVGQTGVEIGGAGIYTVTRQIEEAATALHVRLQNNHATEPTTIKIKRAKLEPGPISTLALDGPADYGAELARCQRYYVNYPDRIYLPGASNNTGTFFYALVNLPTTMRIAPTVTSGNGIQLDVGGTRPEANIAYTGIVYATTSQLTLKYTPTTAIPVNQAGVILVESMALSAEL